MADSRRTLPLFSTDTPPVRAYGDATTVHAVAHALPAARLWLCLYFPALPLESIPGAGSDSPCAILTGQKSRPVILLANDLAEHAGVWPGMPVNAALALSPELRLHWSNPQRQQQALLELAASAMRFTPWVSLDACGALLLEIAASTALFGGLEALRAAAIGQVRGHRVRSAIAPTARAALWLARSGRAGAVTDTRTLPAVLGGLSTSDLGWPRPVQQTLRRMGVRRFDQCVRLPRAGLACRIGTAFLLEMDEALGRRAEVRPACRQDSRFRLDLELPSETRESGAMLQALRVLLDRLCALLLRRQAGTQVLWVHLHHCSRPATLLRIGLVHPAADSAHFEGLVATRLSATRVEAAVNAITLEADIVALAPVAEQDLLGPRMHQARRLAGLVERLSMRLGAAAIRGVWPNDDHRPEHAWRVIADPGGDRPPPRVAAQGAHRPLWLVEQPLLLEQRRGQPFFHGSLHLERGPERIETGWWDGHDVRRDYYVGRSPQGQRAWVFRDCRSGRWYLHGLFA